MVPPTELWRWLLQDGSFLQPISLAFLLPLLILLLVSCRHRSTTGNQLNPRLPPSPRRLPLVGNLHQLSSLPHRRLRALSQKHGPVMLLQLGQVPTLVVSSAAAAREVMTTFDLAFATRPLSTAADLLSYGSRNVAFAPYGEYWRQAKKAAVVHLLCHSKVRSFRPAREEEVALLVGKIAREASSSSVAGVDLSEAFHSFSAALVSRAITGSRSAGDERNKMFRELIDEATAAIGGLLRLYDAFPSLAWLWSLLGMDSQLRRLFKKWDAFLDQVVDEHERHRAPEGGEGSDGDFVDVLLSIQRDPAAMGYFSISRNDVKAIAMDLVAAGTDTSYTVLEWAMSELVRNAGAMERARREVMEVAGGKPVVTEEDIARMSYLRAVTKEALRLHPPAPLLLPRESMDDAQVQGYGVPRKTTVLVNVWAIARDPASWVAPEEFRPEEFRPERFLDCQTDFRGNDFQFIPFGAGRRLCPGINFAICGIELALANLLHRFHWALPGGTTANDLDMDEAPGITIRRKSNLRLVAIPRFAATDVGM